MPFSHNIPFFSIFLAMVAGILMPLVRRGALARRLTQLVMALEAALSAVLLKCLLDEGESFVYTMGHFPAPWGNELRAGALEAMLALCFSAVMLLSLLGGAEDCRRDVAEGKQNLYALIMCLLMASMLSMIYTNDLFTAYVFIEINAITACAVVSAKEDGASVIASIRYLVFGAMGSGMFLLGISILYGLTGHLLFKPLSEAVAAMTAGGGVPLPLAASLLLMVLGLAVKSAQFPFHAWLPDAHSNATTSASAILSGLVLKGYIVLLIKLVYLLFGMDLFNQTGVSSLLFWLGAAGMIAASLAAMWQEDVKRMIAYSSCAQIGYIFLGLGLGSRAGVLAACVQLLAHAATKPMIFVSAGTMLRLSGGGHSWSTLRGAGRRSPLAGVAYTAGALSLCGLPLLPGFAAKFGLACAALEAPPWQMLAALLALAASSVLNALYYLPSVINIWSRRERPQALRGAGVDFVLAAWCFLLLNLVLGACIGPVSGLLSTGLDMLG